MSTKRREPAEIEITTDALARAIYDAMGEGDHNAYIGIYRPGERVTIDGRFNLSQVARALREHLAPSGGSPLPPAQMPEKPHP